MSRTFFLAKPWLKADREHKRKACPLLFRPSSGCHLSFDHWFQSAETARSHAPTTAQLDSYISWRFVTMRQQEILRHAGCKRSETILPPAETDNLYFFWWPGWLPTNGSSLSIGAPRQLKFQRDLLSVIQGCYVCTWILLAVENFEDQLAVNTYVLVDLNADGYHPQIPDM